MITGNGRPAVLPSPHRIEIARIKTDIRQKNEDEILVDLMRLTRKINDGHTSFPLWGREFDPLREYRTP
jgi:hypothetical protein